MKRYLPVALSLIVVGVLLSFVISLKQPTTHQKTTQAENIGAFGRQTSCARPPLFLQKMNIKQPVIIDLSQKRYKGVALLHGRGFKKVLHPKQWEQYEHFSTYTLDNRGNIYLAPTPFISIHPTTFNLQKKIFKLDSNSGKLSIWLDFEDVHPDEHNPYGINTLTYDCDDNTLWVGAIDESDYHEQKGVIYHIDVATKKILQKVPGFDALTLALIKTQKGKYLLTGSARDNGLYAFGIKNSKISSKPFKVLELPDSQEHIRKIKIKGTNQMELQSIPFTYSMIARSTKKDRTIYNVRFDNEKNRWKISKNN